MPPLPPQPSECVLYFSFRDKSVHESMLRKEFAERKMHVLFLIYTPAQ